MAFRLDLLENALLTCLCAMLTAEGRPVCACHHYHGQTRPPADRCATTDAGENGMGWVRRDVSVWRPSAGASSAVWDGGFCGAAASWETVLEVGVRRCIQAVQEGTEAPDPDLYNQDRELLNLDKQTLYRVLCCDAWGDEGGAASGFSMTSATLAPLGPLGKCSGNILTITVSGDPMATDDQPLLADDDGFSGFVSGPAGGDSSWQT